MVRPALVVAIVLAASSVSAYAITAEELRALSDQKERENIQRKARAKTDSLGTLVPEAPKVSTEAPKVSKYGSPAPATTTPPVATPSTPLVQEKPETGAAPAPIPVVPAISTDRRAPPQRDTTSATSPAAIGVTPAGSPSRKTPQAGTINAAPGESNFYVPPDRNQTANVQEANVVDAVAASTAFGIRTGSWLSASLQRNTTSAETGTVELMLTSSYVGDRRTLPDKTILFAEKTVNGLTRRMELVVTHGITPKGTEFEMRGIVFDPQKTPGLAGVFLLDKKQVASNGLAKGAMAAVGAVIGTIGAGVRGDATKAATQSVLSDSGQVADYNNTQQAVIHVSPQELLIRVEKQF